jgi:hypothetical protein
MERRVPKNPFDDDEAFAKPPRAGSGGKKTVKTASQDDVDELFSYSSSKPKQGYGEHDEEFVNQAVLDLEKHAVNKSQETTSTLKNCLRVADDTMGVGAQTLVSLHEQGVQIERTHEKAVDLDQHLSRGEVWEACFPSRGDPRRPRKSLDRWLDESTKPARRVARIVKPWAWMGARKGRSHLELATTGRRFRDKLMLKGKPRMICLTT